LHWNSSGFGGWTAFGRKSIMVRISDCSDAISENSGVASV